MSACRAGQPPSARIDLGLAIAHATLGCGERRTLREIAAYCECHHSRIGKIEANALQKLRAALLQRHDPVLRELVESVIHRPVGNAELSDGSANNQ